MLHQYGVNSRLPRLGEERGIHFDSCVVEVGRYERSINIWRSS